MDRRQGLEDLEVYQLAMEVGTIVWDIVDKWDYNHKKTVGNQVIRSADSIAANIAEGYGRYFFKENRQFCFYARGSLLETKTWIQKAHDRHLITKKDYETLMEKLKHTHKRLNGYIKYIKAQMNKGD